VPASIYMACSSVEGASTLSEAPVVGLYQYIFVLLPEKDDAVNVPGATSAKTLAPRFGGPVDPSSYRFTDRNRGAAVQRPRRLLAFSTRL
jgi:hypothetical protein